MNVTIELVLTRTSGKPQPKADIEQHLLRQIPGSYFVNDSVYTTAGATVTAPRLEDV